MSANNRTTSSWPGCEDTTSPQGLRGGFSLVELLVVLGVIVLLAGLVTTGVIKAKNAADLARIRSDLMSIGSALDQYANDFKGVYPMASVDLKTGRPMGEHILAKALIGPGPAEDRRRPELQDGYDGPGFRVMQGGRVYQPYLSPDKFKIERIGSYWEILDSYGTPFVYLPKRNTGVRPDVGPVWAPKDNGAKPMYDPLDVTDDPSFAAVVGAALGDQNGDRRIRTPETLRHSGPFILISAGPDKNLHSNTGSFQKADDQYNFER